MGGPEEFKITPDLTAETESEPKPESRGIRLGGLVQEVLRVARKHDDTDLLEDVRNRLRTIPKDERRNIEEEESSIVNTGKEHIRNLVSILQYFDKFGLSRDNIDDFIDTVEGQIESLQITIDNLKNIPAGAVLRRDMLDILGLLGRVREFLVGEKESQKKIFLRLFAIKQIKSDPLYQQLKSEIIELSKKYQLD